MYASTVELRKVIKPAEGGMSFILEGFGVFLGVIAGVCIALAVKRLEAKRIEKSRIKILLFELEYNERKLNYLLDEISKYESAIHSDTLNDYNGYFDVSRMIFHTANEMLQSGALFKYLSNEDIGRLQAIAIELSVSGEGEINSRIQQFKAQSVEQGDDFDKQDVYLHAQNCANIFITHRNTIKIISEKFS